MKSIRRAFAVSVAALAIGTGASLFAPVAIAQTKIKMVLNWKYQGPQAWFFVAQDRGYFKAEGLDVEIDQGEGSSAPIAKIAAGAYTAGFGDINAVIDFAARRPSEAPVGVYMLYNTPPFTVAVKADGPIRSPKDFEGPWATTARMETLRSPKQLTGPALGLPALTFRAWYEAQFGTAVVLIRPAPFVSYVNCLMTYET